MTWEPPAFLLATVPLAVAGSGQLRHLDGMGSCAGRSWIVDMRSHAVEIIFGELFAPYLEVEGAIQDVIRVCGLLGIPDS